MTDFFLRQIAKASLQEKVVSGQNVFLNVDLSLAHDGSGPKILELFKTNGRHPATNSKILITLDHAFPAPTVKDREFQREISDFARQTDIRLYKKGEGVLHQVVAEEELLWPGMIIVGVDGHVATAGAFGAIAFSVTPEEFVQAVCEGTHLIRIPEQMVIAIDGKLNANVMARDIAMHLMSKYGDEIKDKAVLLTGNTIDKLTISEKMSICNFLPEAGVVTALVLPEGERRTVDISIESLEIEPMLGVPGKAIRFTNVGSLTSEKITVAIAGGCSSGRLDDMQTIADVLTKKKVHPNVTFIITPGSRSIMESMDRLKISSILRNAGAIIMSPGCGPCPGKHFGVLCDSDTAITTTIRNSSGRIGAEGAKIYLASPLTVASSAVNGKITEPI